MNIKVITGIAGAVITAAGTIISAIMAGKNMPADDADPVLTDAMDAMNNETEPEEAEVQEAATDDSEA